MKTFFTRLLVGVALCGLSLAKDTSASRSNTTESQSEPGPATQAAQSQPEQTGGAPRIAPGSVIPVELTKTIDAKKVKTGDEVEAKVTQDMKAGNGEVIMPKDTKVMGRITEAQARSKEQKESQVGIAFDHVVMKNGAGGPLPLPMSIQAIIAPLNPNNNDSAGTAQPSSMPNAGGASPGGRAAGMGAGTPPPVSSPSVATEESPTNSQSGNNTRPPITGKTQGVVGMSNVQLSIAANPAEGSIVSSEKSNVKLESGTMMLLKVNQ